MTDNMITRADPLVYDQGATPDWYGPCPPLLDLCAGDALVSLCMSGTYNPLINWIGFESSNVKRLERNFITYTGVEGTAAGAPIPTLQNDVHCKPGPGTEFGLAHYVCEGFDPFKISGKVRNDTEEVIKWCEEQPMYRVDGTVIEDNDEWDMMQMGSALINDLHKWLPIQLEQTITPTYTDPKTGQQHTSLAGNVVNWAGQPMCPTDGQSGATWNNNAVTATGLVLYDFIKDAVRRNIRRIMTSPTLKTSKLRAGNMLLVMPHDWIECFLDCYTCYVKCSNDISRMDTFEARTFRDSLDGGMFSNGWFRVSGLTIPILGYDHGLIKTDGTADMYLLTNNIKNQKLIGGQHKNMGTVAARNSSKYESMDNGLFLMHEEYDHTCYQRHMQMDLRLCLPGMWAQHRFTGVACEQITEYMSIDPSSPYYIEKNLVAAQSTC